MKQISSSLSYDVVIASRNRPEALSLSIPEIISQSLPPERLIVIDSSDDHAPVAKAVADAVAGWQGRVIVEHVEPGLPQQRNRGLLYVNAGIVMFPDDDSILFPGAAEEIVAVYHRDKDGRVAGVCAAEAQSPPIGFRGALRYEMTKSHRLEARSRRLRNWLEKRISALKPAIFLGRKLGARYPLPDWLNDADVVPVEYMTGFRMSFRTEVIRETGFDEALGGYALDEDVDASFTAMQKGLLVGARRARIYHHRFPTGRGDGARLGRMEVLNRIYVGRKHAARAEQDRRLAKQMDCLLRSFVIIKLIVALQQIQTPFGRARLAGTWSAILASGPLWRAGPDRIEKAYKAAFKRAEEQ